MSHEKSETVKRGKRWYNVVGQKLSPAYGKTLGEQGGYATQEEAEQAARRRSQQYRPKKPWYGHK